jgi:hypothetical protein
VDRKSVVTRPDGVLLREIEGESVLVNLDNGQYYGLDDVGTRLYQLLVDSADVGAAIETALAEYDVDAETLQRDLAELVDRLTVEGLIEVKNGGAGE